jgi:ribosomal protein S18 acetylase RimI-like enzyme
MERLDEIFIIVPGPADAAALANVHIASWRETYAGLLPAADLARMSAPVHARRFRRQLASGQSDEVCLAAEGRNGLVGYCAGHRRAGWPLAEVSTLYVLRSAQNVGLGRKLLSSTARTLQAGGARGLRLWVLSSNDRAKGFYRRLGGEQGAERAVTGWGGGLRETAFLWSDIRRLTAGD